jgi:type IV pilus assembly protein PilV
MKEQGRRGCSVVMKQKNEKGFTLLEVMVSAAILGVGVMGMAAMQGISVKKNVDMNELALANNAAVEMLERVQSNRQYAWTYNTLNTGTFNATGAPLAGNCAALPVAAPAPPQDAKQLATLALGLQLNITRTVAGDCTQWGAQLGATRLQNVRGVVAINSLPPVGSRNRQAVVTVNWTDGRQGSRPRSVTIQGVVVSENGG